LIPPTTHEELTESLRIGQAYLHSLGVTAWQDAIVGPPELDAYVALAANGELTARVVAALWWDRARGEEQIVDLLELRARGVVGRLRATSVKIMQDGVLENFTAGVLDPYLDRAGNPTMNRGKSFIEPELLTRAVSRLDAEGFQVHVHAIGERAVREALDAFEAAREVNGPNDHRHHIAHIQIVHPDDLPRFARLGVTANGQPFWACLDGQMVDLTIPFIGPQRAAWQYPFASLLRSGARLAFGSDWPVSTPNPLAEMQVAVTRRVDGNQEHGVLLPEQILGVQDAVAAFTRGSAYVNHLDDETGVIRAGMLADLVVLDRDLFALEPPHLSDAAVRQTLVQGEPVYEADGWSW
jgi:predicted amidohydrolase YtcJ